MTIDSPEALKTLIEKECAMVSILGISDEFTEESDQDKITYKGGLYFDIDFDGEINKSIEALYELLGKLKYQGVDRQDILVWASGKKGFHIIIPEKVFSSGRPTRYLPYIYKEMALELFVDGIDMVVYSGKKGRLWRQENVRRSDNGMYKVGLLPEEVENLTVQSYADIILNSRNIEQLTPCKQAPKLSVLFELCKKRTIFKQKQKKQNIESEIADEVLAQFSETLPGCIQKLVEEGDSEGTSNFNQAAMQFGIFVARSKMHRNFWQPFVDSMAKNVTSGTYKSEKSRSDHLVGMIRYAASSKSMKFSRGALFSVIEPCGSCPICQSEDGSLIQDVAEDNLAGITERSDGYYIKTADGARRITTYTLKPENYFTTKAQDTELTRRVGIEACVVVNGIDIVSVRIDEGAWDSKSGLIKELRGIHNLAFLGGDQEVQRLKHYLFTKEFDMGEIQQVFSAGIHRHPVGKLSTLVYVEPGFSVTAQKERDTHYVDGRIPAPPRISSQEFPDTDNPEFRETIKALLKVNQPHIVGQILGWYAACHLKVHLQSVENQFPILNLWGNAESGKTTTACLFACLSGCDYIMEDSPLSLGGATPWAVANFAASSTTIPRLLDEFNKSKIKEASYNYFAEVMKAAWNNQTFSRGSVTSAAKADGKGRSGAAVIDYKISGPLAVMSEQSPEMPALKQRMVQVSMSTKSREGCDDYFYITLENRKQLWRASRAMVWASLDKLPSWSSKKMKDYREVIPKKIEARSNYSYRVVLTGLDFFQEVMEGLKLDLTTEIEDLKKAVLTHLSGHEQHISRDKGKTEVDAVMEAFNIMAGMEDGSSGRNYLVSGKQYILSEGKLYVDTLMAHAMYRRYARSFSERVVISNHAQFATLLKQEGYFIESKKLTVVSSIRNMEVLDMEAMAEKGLETGHFHSEAEIV